MRAKKQSEKMTHSIGIFLTSFVNCVKIMEITVDHRIKGADTMKKLIVLLICALLAFTTVLAEGDPFDQFETQGPDDDMAKEDGITLELNGESICLAFDPSPQYSNVQDGMVQASYYAYGQDGVTMYEMYISFPQTARAGMIITPEYEAITNGDASVSLVISKTKTDQVYYFSSLADGLVYPMGSTFSIAIDSITDTDQGACYAGTFSATLIALDLRSGDELATLAIPETPFSFTLGDVLAPSPSPRPESDLNDMRKV